MIIPFGLLSISSEPPAKIEHTLYHVALRLRLSDHTASDQNKASTGSGRNGERA